MCVSGCVYWTADSDATVRGEVAGGPGQFVTPSAHLYVCPGVYIGRQTVTRRCVERWRVTRASLSHRASTYVCVRVCI